MEKCNIYCIDSTVLCYSTDVSSFSLIISSFAILTNPVRRLNYSANYTDVEDVTVTAIDFDRIAGLKYYSSGFLQYFLDRGYTADVDIRIASYDWRLAPGNINFYFALLRHHTITHTHTHTHTQYC